MKEGHLTNHPDWFNEEYQALREVGLDFYYVVRNHKKDVFILPNEEVRLVNNRVEMTPEIVNIFQCIFKTKRKNIWNKVIFPYIKIEEGDSFTQGCLEEMKYGRQVDVHSA